MTLDWIGWAGLSHTEQLYGVAAGSFAMGGSVVLAVEALFSSRGQRRKKRKRGRS